MKDDVSLPFGLGSGGCAELFSVGFTDFYIRMCSMGVLSDPRIL